MPCQRFLRPLLAAAALFASVSRVRAASHAHRRALQRGRRHRRLCPRHRGRDDEARHPESIVDNKPGASGMIAADAVARAKPDGLTLFMGSNSTLANNVVLFEKMPYDPFKAFTPVSHIGYQPSILIARANAPFKDLKEYIAYAKANPGKVNRAHVGAGNISNLAGEMLDKAAGIKTSQIPYTGDPLAIQATAERRRGRVRRHDHAGATAHAERQSCACSASSTASTWSRCPRVPTFKEAGYNLDAYAWYCLVAPTGTPAATVDAS